MARAPSRCPRKRPVPSPEPVSRVLRLSPATRDAARKARDRSGIPMRSFLTKVVAEQLPQLAKDVAALGLAADAEKVAAKWQFDLGTLARLRDASDRSGLPSNTLLTLCIRRHTRRGGRRSTIRK